MNDRPQSYANHRALPSPLYITALGLWVLLLVLACVLVRDAVLVLVLLLIASLAGVLAHLSARRMSQRLQDRIIRLEMELRLARLGLDGAGLSLAQLIALRFASDAQVPELLQRVRSGSLIEPDAIKRAISGWRPDWMRV